MRIYAKQLYSDLRFGNLDDDYMRQSQEINEYITIFSAQFANDLSTS